MIYLDSAATSFIKPPAVKKAMLKAVNSLASPGRGGYPAAMKAAELCYLTREKAGEMFGCLPENVVLTFNATHGLNIAINSLVSAGDKVVISGFEHNAVTRPLYALNANVAVSHGRLFCPDEILESVEAELQDAKCCICTHVSNVFGYVLPIDEIAALCRERGVPLIVDASQSAGVLPVNMAQWGAAFVAMPGHKGLFGAQGTGLLLCNGQTRPIMYGGTGVNSISRVMPEDLPERLEAGTHNMPGIAALLAGMNFVSDTGIERISRHECYLRRILAFELNKFPNVWVYESGDNRLQSGVLSVAVEGMDCQEIASLLGQRGVAVRAGLHCAPLAHKTADTLECGTVRFSFSPFNNSTEITRTAKIMGDILNKS